LEQDGAALEEEGGWLCVFVPPFFAFSFVVCSVIVSFLFVVSFHPARLAQRRTVKRRRLVRRIFWAVACWLLRVEAGVVAAIVSHSIAVTAGGDVGTLE
jgi:hypothetical protein